MFLYLFTLSHFSKLVVLPGTFLCSQQITWNMFEKGFVSGEILSEFIQVFRKWPIVINYSIRAITMVHILFLSGFLSQWWQVTMVTMVIPLLGQWTLIVTFLPSRSMNLTGRNSNVHNTPLTNKSRYPRLSPCNYNTLKIIWSIVKQLIKREWLTLQI